MSKITQCLVLIGSKALDTISIYEKGHKFIAICNMLFVSVKNKLYSISCPSAVKIDPTIDDMASLIECDRSLVNNGQEYIKNTNIAITKYTINAGLKYYTKVMTKNSHNFHEQNLTSDVVHPKYDGETCEVLPDDCTSTLVEDYINKTLSILNDWSRSDVTSDVTGDNSTSAPSQSDIWYFTGPVVVGIGGAGIVGALVYLYYNRVYKSKQPNEGRRDNDDYSLSGYYINNAPVWGIVESNGEYANGSRGVNVNMLSEEQNWYNPTLEYRITEEPQYSKIDDQVSDSVVNKYEAVRGTEDVNSDVETLKSTFVINNYPDSQRYNDSVLQGLMSNEEVYGTTKFDEHTCEHNNDVFTYL